MANPLLILLVILTSNHRTIDELEVDVRSYPHTKFAILAFKIHSKYSKIDKKVGKLKFFVKKLTTNGSKRDIRRNTCFTKFVGYQIIRIISVRDGIEGMCP